MNFSNFYVFFVTAFLVQFNNKNFPFGNDDSCPLSVFIVCYLDQSCVCCSANIKFIDIEIHSYKLELITFNSINVYWKIYTGC